MTNSKKNSKLQTPNSRKTPNSKLQTGDAEGYRSLEFGAFLELGVWNLEFLLVFLPHWPLG
jgi:hypothetical protein